MRGFKLLPGQQPVTSGNLLPAFLLYDVNTLDGIGPVWLAVKLSKRFLKTRVFVKLKECGYQIHVILATIGYISVFTQSPCLVMAGAYFLCYNIIVQA